MSHSCSHCAKQASFQTECCGRAYCGEACLGADLIEHDLECIEINLPQWLRRKGQGDVQMIKRKGGVPQMVYGYESKSKRDQALQEFQSYKNEQRMARTASSVFIIKSGQDYQARIAAIPKRLYWIVY